MITIHDKRALESNRAHCATEGRPVDNLCAASRSLSRNVHLVLENGDEVRETGFGFLRTVCAQESP